MIFPPRVFLEFLLTPDLVEQFNSLKYLHVVILMLLCMSLIFCIYFLPILFLLKTFMLLMFSMTSLMNSVLCCLLWLLISLDIALFLVLYSSVLLASISLLWFIKSFVPSTNCYTKMSGFLQLYFLMYRF